MTARELGLPQTGIVSICYEGVQLGVGRPMSENDAIGEARKRFPEQLGDPKLKISFSTIELRDLRGDSVTLTEDIWETAIKEVSRLNIIVTKPFLDQSAQATLPGPSVIQDEVEVSAVPRKSKRKLSSDMASSPVALKKRSISSSSEPKPVTGSVDASYELSDGESEPAEGSKGFLPLPTVTPADKRGQEPDLPTVGPEEVTLYTLEALRRAIDRVGMHSRFSYEKLEAFVTRFLAGDFGGIHNVKCSTRPVNARPLLLPRVDRCLAQLKENTNLKEMVPILNRLHIDNCVLDIRAVLMVLIFRRSKNIQRACDRGRPPKA